MRTNHRRRPARGSPRGDVLPVLGGAVLLGLAVAVGSVALERPARSLRADDPAEVLRHERSVYYSGCREARAAGAAPIYRGEPGYRPEMDGDDDGVACEPYRGD